MKMKKLLSLMLALTMGLSVVACGGSDNAGNNDVPSTENGSNAGTEGEELSYEEQSRVIYDKALGDFYATYSEAREIKDNISERYAQMAISEAKLLEAAIMIPLTAKGGNYAISRLAPYSMDYSLWGNDNERVHQAIVTTEPIETVHRDEMKAKWLELKGTGTYEDWAKSYLEENGYTIKDSYVYIYPSDPLTWDVLATSQAADSEMIVQTYDGLLEYDVEGTLQPALAESYEVSEDGLTYTFHLREGLKWVDSQGREVADVKADDFVAGFQHMLDSMGGLEYLVQGVVVNADEYINGVVTDFNEVGVKAVDDYTVAYTLTAPTHYFTTMLGYGVFAPMSRAYYESQGGKFGAEYDPSAVDYSYGKTPDNIAYNGPFVVTNATEKNTIVFKANESYWNKDNTNIKSYTVLFNDGSEATKSYTDTKAGTIDGAGLNSSSVELAKTDGWFEKYAYVSTPNATTFPGFFNLNRAAFANANDETKAVSAQTEDIIARTHAAMNNVHFRRALIMSIDRGTYNAQKVGEDLRLTSLRNTYLPGNFVSLEEEVTVDINGTATTFPAGTDFGEIVQAQITADGLDVTVYKAGADNGSDGYDGWYNPDAAVAELEAAIAELEAEGVTIDAENPIHIDYPHYAGSETYTNSANALKQSVETVLGGKVIVDLTPCVDAAEWYYAGYYTSYGYEANYDFYDVSGWGPDYGDPSTYLDTFLPEFAGYMAKCIGIY